MADFIQTGWDVRAVFELKEEKDAWQQNPQQPGGFMSPSARMVAEASVLKTSNFRGMPVSTAPPQPSAPGSLAMIENMNQSLSQALQLCGQVGSLGRERELLPRACEPYPELSRKGYTQDVIFPDYEKAKEWKQSSTGKTNPLEGGYFS
jgi:hypothetical protein